MGGIAMTGRLPGSWVHDLARRFLDEATVESLIAPVIADLQYEVGQAGADARRRRRAHVQGYVALGKILIVGGVWRRWPMRRALAVLVLGAAGAASLIYPVWPFMAGNGPTLLLPFFAMAVIAPFLLRQLGLGRTYAQLFAACACVGMIMATAVIARTLMAQFGSLIGWQVFVAPLVFLSVFVAFGSAISAAVAWKPPAGADPGYRRVLVTLAVGYAVFAAADAGREWHYWFTPRPGPSAVLRDISLVAFRALLFAMAASVVHVPVSLIARRVLPGRVPLVVINSLLFPVPLFGIPYLAGHPEVWRYFIQDPLFAQALQALPYAAAGAALGWGLSLKSQRQAPVPLTG